MDHRETLRLIAARYRNDATDAGDEAAFLGCTVNVEVHVDIEGGACLDVPQLGKAKCPQPDDDAGAEAGN